MRITLDLKELDARELAAWMLNASQSNKRFIRNADPCVQSSENRIFKKTLWEVWRQMNRQLMPAQPQRSGSWRDARGCAPAMTSETPEAAIRKVRGGRV